MKLIFRIKDKIISELETFDHRLTYEQIDTIESFNERIIESFKVEFNSGVTLKSAHDFKSVPSNQIKSITAFLSITDEAQ